MTGGAARIAALLALSACGGPESDDDVDDTLPCDERSVSTCLKAILPPEYYAEQGFLYFDTLDESAPPESGPSYATGVARWEWPPWLLLTGYGAEFIEAADKLVLANQPGTTVPERDCRAFDVQPFSRCRVVMDYQGKSCPIYEELTFDANGLVTFVEAWSDLPGLRPTDAAIDPFAEGEGVHRLSTRLPGLGIGLLDPSSAAMYAAAANDPEIADFQRRTEDFWGTWGEALRAAGDDLYERGCGWESPQG